MHPKLIVATPTGSLHARHVMLTPAADLAAYGPEDPLYGLSSAQYAIETMPWKTVVAEGQFHQVCGPFEDGIVVVSDLDALYALARIALKTIEKREAALGEE